jgi:hypothetical protein
MSPDLIFLGISLFLNKSGRPEVGKSERPIVIVKFEL